MNISEEFTEKEKIPTIQAFIIMTVPRDLNAPIQLVKENDMIQQVITTLETVLIMEKIRNPKRLRLKVMDMCTQENPQ